MEHIFNLIEVDSSNSRIKVSITESTMMQILHSSMDKAYRKVKSKTGVLERLNEISKFYELAVMQLEGCLKFVQEETGSHDLESSQELLVEDLTEIRDRLLGRLNEVEMAISDKDKELLERLGNESKLRKALEINEKKTDSLYADLELEQRKSEGIEELFLVKQASIGNGDSEGEFCELKNSVDLQVWNIQQQLDPNNQLEGEERNQGINNKKIEKMGSDIGVLKETLDLAFCKMHNAIFLSELGPIEHQWMWNIERCIVSIAIKGCLNGFQQNFEDEVKKREMQVSLRKHLSDLIREITCLNHELQLLSNLDEVRVKNFKPKGPLKGRCLSIGQNLGNSNDLSLKVEEDDGSHHVAKMIKNHGHRIRRKSDELELLTQELLREKPSLPLRRSKDSVDPKRKIQEVIAKLESLVNLNPGIDDILDELQRHPDNQMEKSGINSMQEVWEKVNKISVSQARNKDQCSEVKILKQEMEDANLQNMIMEETYLTLFQSLMDEFRIEMLNHCLHGLITEGMYENFIEAMQNEWNEKTGSDRIEVQIRGEKSDTVFVKATKDLDCLEDQTFSGVGNLDGMQEEVVYVMGPLHLSQKTSLVGAKTFPFLSDLELMHHIYFFRALWHDIYTIVLREILEEWNENIETFKPASSLGEELCCIVFGEIVRDIINTSNAAFIKLQEIKVDESSNYDIEFGNKFSETAAMLIEDDVLKVFLADMIKELQMKIYDFSIESLIKEEVHQLVIVEAVKQGCILDKSDDWMNQEQHSICSISFDNLTHTLDRLMKLLEDKEALILTACSETKQQKSRIEHVASGFDDEIDEHKHQLGLVPDDGNSTNPADIRLQKALQQLDFAKALLTELISQLGQKIGNFERLHEEMNPLTATKHYRKTAIDEAETIKEIKVYESVLNPIQELSQTLKILEFESCSRLGRHVSRLDEMKVQLDLLAKLTASFIQKESLYKKAFIRRCENLQMAEAEVDLLGDQVDQLQGLLQKIYITLHQHSPVLQQYFEVLEMLKLIEKEIGER